MNEPNRPQPRPKRTSLRLASLLLVSVSAVGAWAWWTDAQWQPLAPWGVVHWQRSQNNIHFEWATPTGAPSSDAPSKDDPSNSNDGNVSNHTPHLVSAKKPSNHDNTRGLETRADWYAPLFDSCSYVVVLSRHYTEPGGGRVLRQQVAFWYRLDGKTRGADGRDLMGMFACNGVCAVPDGIWALPDESGNIACEVIWCHGQICSVRWTQRSGFVESDSPR